MRVRHSKVSSKSDGADSTLVRPSDWNADHSVDIGDLVIVSSAADFPAAVAGVRTLVSGKTYMLTGDIDLGGDRIVGSERCAIIGTTAENSSLTSTGLTGAALISSTFALPIRNLSITAQTALDLNGGTPGSTGIDIQGVRFVSCATVGTVANFANFLMANVGFVDSGGLTIDGQIGTVGIRDSLFDTASGQTAIIIPSTAVITRRFRVIYSSFVTGSGETGINVSTSATIPVEGYILDTVNFSGSGTYTAGIAYTDNRARWDNNRGISNSAAVAYYTMQGNATATTISAQNTPVKAAGTTTAQAITQKFTHTANRATYTGGLPRTFKVTVACGIEAGNNQQIGILIAKDGVVAAQTESVVTTSGSGRGEGATTFGVFELTAGQYVEVWVENQTAVANVTVTDLSVIVEALN